MIGRAPGPRGYHFQIFMRADYAHGSVIHTNLAKLLLRRGYTTPPDKWDPSYRKTELDAVLTVVASETRTPCAVFISDGPNVNVAIARLVEQTMREENCVDTILVCHAVTSSASALFAELLKNGKYVVQITPKELTFDLMSHSEVPPQFLLDDDEARRELSAYGVSKKQIAKIRLSDAVCRRLGAHLDDVIRVERRRVTVERSISFRHVVL